MWIDQAATFLWSWEEKEREKGVHLDGSTGFGNYAVKWEKDKGVSLDGLTNLGDTGRV